MRFLDKETIEPELEEQLESLKKMKVERDPSTVAKNRAAFIAQVENLAVSKTVQKRLTLQNHIQRMVGSGKERLVMSPTLVSIVLAVALFFGGSGVGVAAAQNSLPDQVLYPVKLLTENVQELLTTQPKDKLDLEMNLSQTRVEEIGAVLHNGDIPEDSVLSRLQNHLLAAFQLAAETNPQDPGEMLRLHDQLQEQLRMVEQLQTGENAREDDILLRTRDMLQTQIQLIDDSLAAPDSKETQSQDQTGDQNQNTNQDVIENQNQDMSQNQNQDEIQNQNQDMSQNENLDSNHNQNQDVIENQNEDLSQNQNQEETQNQNSNQSSDNGSGSSDSGQNPENED